MLGPHFLEKHSGHSGGGGSGVWGRGEGVGGGFLTVSHLQRKIFFCPSQTLKENNGISRGAKRLYLGSFQLKDALKYS